ncbi:MAG: GNAT family N-acetyltransferase, partial [Candidatus Sericytochromatia bacterium]|nr:GNAT family N-acetyltransferase [Candidatus Tanganyikabacteria bacterium]
AEEQSRDFGRPFKAHLRGRAQLKAALTDTRYCMLVGLVDSDVVAYVQAEHLPDEGKPTLWIKALYVPRTFRRTTLARNLITELRRASEDQGDGEMMTRCGSGDEMTTEALREVGLKDKYVVMRMPVVRKEGWNAPGRSRRIS